MSSCTEPSSEMFVSFEHPSFPAQTMEHDFFNSAQMEVDCELCKGEFSWSTPEPFNNFLKLSKKSKESMKLTFEIRDSGKGHKVSCDFKASDLSERILKLYNRKKETCPSVRLPTYSNSLSIKTKIVRRNKRWGCMFEVPDSSLYQAYPSLVETTADSPLLKRRVKAPKLSQILIKDSFYELNPKEQNEEASPRKLTRSKDQVKLGDGIDTYFKEEKQIFTFSPIFE